MATENQFFNKFAYKPYIDYQYCQQSYTTETTSSMIITQQTNYATVNNDLASSTSSSSSSLLSSYPLASSIWQNSYPTDYLGLPTFDQHQQSSPTVSVLSSLSPSSASSASDMMVYAADDFCVSDLMDSQSQQPHMLSPMFTNTTTSSNDHYYAQQSMQQQQQPSPRSEYWISPATPLMESMDGYMTNGMDHHQQPGCLFVKQEDEGSVFMSTTPPFNIEMTTPMTITDNNKPTSAASSSSSSSSSSTVLGPIKKKSKKIHHCPHCNHTSNRANNMKEHVLTHDPHRPKLFACNTCQKSFARKHDMKRHAKSHFKVPRRQPKSSTSTQKQQKV